MLQKEIRFPTRIMLAEGDIRGAENLLKPVELQCPTGKYPSRPWAELRGKCSLLFDFGEEMRAGLRILCHWLVSPTPNLFVSARIRFGESVAECCVDIGERGSTNNHSPRDFYATLVGMSDVVWGSSGFRFARVDLDLPEKTCLNLLAVAAEGQILSMPAKYVYTGKDQTLADIYRVAKRTIDLCAAGEYVWDGIKRDRLVWIGDMHPEMLALTTLYGRVPAFENSMVFMRDTTPIGTWMCNISTYTAWWLICLADYYARTGCAEFVAPMLPYAQETVKHLLTCVDKEGNIGANDDKFRMFVDWPTKGSEDEAAGGRAIFLWMAKKAAALFSAMAAPTANAVELINRLQKQPIKVKSSMQVAGLKYMATEKLDKSEIALLEKWGAKGMSTFMSYYILTAYAHYFGKEAAISIMKEYYGGMLSRGATTFWEDFNLAWLDGSSRVDEFPAEGEKDLHGDYGAHCYLGFRHSFCHAWSTGVLRFMEDCGV